MDLLAALRWPGGSVGLIIPSVTVAGRTVASAIAARMRKRRRECYRVKRLVRWRTTAVGEPVAGPKKVLQTGPYDGVPDPLRAGTSFPPTSISAIIPGSVGLPPESP